MGEMTKVAFLDTMREKRDHWEALLSKIQNELIERPGVDGNWSVRDIIVHVTAYERGLVEWLAATSEGVVKTFPILDHPDVEYRNSRILEERKRLSTQKVAAEADEAFRRLMALIEAIPEEELFDPELTAWYVVPRWKQKRALWECIADDSYRHYDQHFEGIQRWLEAKGGNID